MLKARILNENEEKLWDRFLEKSPLATIHQSSTWGQFQKKISYHGKFWIVVLEEEGKIVGGSMIIRRALPKGFCWLYASRGPILDYEGENVQEQMDALIKIIKKIGKKEKAIFLRIDPHILKDQKYPKLKGFSDAPYGFHPEATQVVNISATEEEILKQMKPKGRYNIKVAKKRGVEVVKAHPKKAEEFQKEIKEFFEVFEETTMRDGFKGHGQDFYKHMVEILGNANLAELLLAKYEGKTIAGIIATYYKETATYYYGASSNQHRNVMAPYLLQWEAMQEGKRRGCSAYDFLGIAKSDDPKDPWAGITQFKKKFGGEKLVFHAAREYKLSPFLYWAYRIYKSLNR